MLNLGTVKPGSTIYIPFDTFAGATGASITMTGLAVGDILIYKNGSVTQRASTTGFTLLDTDGIDFDALTGIHGFSIDLSSNATADFYTAGADYFVVISTITIDSQVVSFVAARFRIGYPDAILDTTIATLASQTSFTLTAGPAEDDALNGCIVCIHDIASAVQLGFAIIADYTGSTKTVTLLAGVTFTAAAGDNISIFTPIVVASLATQAKADVKTEAVAALATDTYAEPGQGAPAATATLAAKINYLYKSWRNKKTETITTFSLFADDASTVDQKATVSDDGTTTTIGEVATGP